MRTRRVRRTAPLALVAALIGGLLVAGLGSPTSALTAAPERELYLPELTVESWGEDAEVTLTADTFEWVESVPTYNRSLINVDTGEKVGLGFGWADSIDGELEGPYSVSSTVPLPHGLYEFELRIQTQGFWHCSPRDPDGCSWWEGERQLMRWRFDFAGEDVTTGYRAPKRATSLRLAKKEPWRKKGWQVSVRLSETGEPLKNQALIGQYKSRGKWRRDGEWRTNSNGRLTLQFFGEKRPTKYRFMFPGDEYRSQSTSRTFGIAAR